MKIIDFSKQKSIINKYVRELRDKDIQRDRLRFRQNVIRIGHAMAYEVSKVLEYGEVELDTPLAKAKAVVPSEDIVIATVFRAGLPLHQGFLDVFDDAGNAFVSAYRYYKDKEGTEVAAWLNANGMSAGQDSDSRRSHARDRRKHGACIRRILHERETGEAHHGGGNSGETGRGVSEENLPVERRHAILRRH